MPRFVIKGLKLPPREPTAVEKVKVFLKAKNAVANVDSDRSKAIDRRVAARERYRAVNAVSLDTCLHNLDHVEDFATLSIITTPEGKTREWLVLSSTQLSGPLDTSAMTISRWIISGMLPAPIFKTGRGKCYHIDEVRSFVKIIGEQQANFKQYRASHTDTKEKLFDENSRIRKNLMFR